MPMTRVHLCWLAGSAALGVAVFLLGYGFRPATDTNRRADVPPHRHDPPDKPQFAPSRRPPGALKPRPPELPAPVPPPYPADSPEQQDWIATRIADLNALAWYDDAESLHRILAELSNPLPEIQAAALTATIAFGSRDAIPYLEQLAAQARDPKQQQALTEAIAYLRQPTLLEKLDQPPADHPE